MNIPLKMNRDFEKAMTTLNERYGEDFEYLNGFHETQLNFSDFIDGFIDKNVADVTIDANANASNKDIRPYAVHPAATFPAANASASPSPGQL